jgi:hypothetical protein
MTQGFGIHAFTPFDMLRTGFDQLRANGSVLYESLPSVRGELVEP